MTTAEYTIEDTYSVYTYCLNSAYGESDNIVQLSVW